MLKKLKVLILISCIVLLSACDGQKQTTYVEKPWKITYVNMYQSNATIITFPNEKTLVIDSGINSGSKAPIYSNVDNANHPTHPIAQKYTLLYPRLVKALKTHGIKKGDKIDYYIETHCDPDHNGGSAELIRDYQVKKYYRPNIPMEFVRSPAQLNQTNVMMKKRKVKAIYPHRDEVIKVGNGNTIEFLNRKLTAQDFANYNYSYANIYGQLDSLNTDKKYRASVVNAFSLAFMVKINNQKFLFCGDMNKPELDELANHYQHQLKCDILLAPHHGSNKAASASFYELANPNITVVSCGRNCEEGNCYNHPQAETLALMQQYSKEIIYTYNYQLGYVKKGKQKIAIHE